VSRKTQKLYTSRTNNLDANTYVGEAGRLFYDEPTTTHTAPILRYSDGVTVGGVPLFTLHNILPADAVGFLHDDGAGNLTWTSTPTDYSDANVITLLSGNITTGNVINTGDYYYANGASLTSTIENFVANVDFGNLYITDETIHGKISGRDITLAPAGVASVVVPSLKIPVGSIISNTNAISVTVANLTLESVVEYSTSTMDNLLIGDYGLTNGISGGDPGWTVYRFTTTPAPVLQIGDHLAATGMPFLSNVLFVGNVSGTDDANANIVITSQTIRSLPTPPEPGAVVYTTRDVVNSGFLINTQTNTDISLVPGSGGSTITAANFLPLIDDVYDLGSPTRRWRHLWMGAGTIYVLDETLGTDQTIGARDGNLYVGGGSGLTVGKFTLYGNTIALANSTEDFYIGTQYATGNLNIRRPLQILNNSGNVAFQVDRNGKAEFFDAGLNSGQSAVSIIATLNKAEYPVTAPLGGSLIHSTARDGTPAIVTLDSAAGSASAGGYYLSRRFRGNISSPAAVQAGDTMLLLGTAGYNGTGFRTGVSSARITFKAAELFNSTSQSAYTEFRNQVVGTGVDAVSAVIDANGLTIPSTPQGGTGSAGIRFTDNTFQNTAWVPANNIQQITVGTGFTPSEQGTRTGNISLNTVDVHSVQSASYSLTVANITPNSQNLRLTLAQEIGSNSSPTFANLYVGGNLYVAGNVISQGSASIQGKILYLANNSVTSADINGGGIQLGANGAAYARTLTYNLTGPHGDYWSTDTDTGFQTEHLNATDAYLSGNLYSNGTAYFGGALTSYVYPNAGIQVFENVNSYAQIVEQNLSTGTKATTDFIATANNGTDTTYYVDLGIAGSNYDNTNPDNSLGTSLQPNDSYLYAQGNTSANMGGNLVIGATVPGRVIRFIAGGVNATNVVETISDTGVAVVGNISATGNIGATYYTGSAKYLTDIPVQINSDWNNVDPASFANIRNRPDLSVYATVTQLTTNVTTINNSINTLTANAAYQEGEIAGLRANITTANVNIQTLNANIGAYETWANSSITAGNVAWQANAAFQNTWLANLQANVATINNSVTNISGNAALTFVTNAAQNIGNAKNTLLSLFGLDNGVALTTNTRYQYEIVFNANCSKAGAMSYALANTATIAQHNYTVQSNKTTTVDGYTAGITMMSFNATGSSITTGNPIADTGTFTHTEIYGTIDVVTGGTVNFMVSQDQNTPVTWYVLPGAFIRLFPLGPIGANTVIGTWS